MRAFLASDVIYSQRVAPLIQEALDDNDVSGQHDRAELSSCPTSAGSTPTPSPSGSARSARAAARRQRERPRRACTATASSSVAVGGRRCSPRRAVNHITASSDVAFTVAFQNQGDNDETDVVVQRHRARRGQADHGQEDGQPDEGQAAGHGHRAARQAPPSGQPVTIDVGHRGRARREEHDEQQADLHGALHRGRGSPAAAYRRGVDDLTSTAGIVALGAVRRSALVALVVAVVALVRLRRLRADQRACSADTARRTSSRTRPALDRDFAGAARLRRGRRRAASHGRLEAAEQRLDGALAYRGLVRYDAYNEMSGRQSTSIALLDAARSGVVLSLDPPPRPGADVRQAVHQGEGELQLSPEEEEAVRVARQPPPTRRRLDARLRRYLGPEGTFTHEALLGDRARRRRARRALPTRPRGRPRRAGRRGRPRARADRERARGRASTRRSTRSPSTPRTSRSSARSCCRSTTA